MCYWDRAGIGLELPTTSAMSVRSRSGKNLAGLSEQNHTNNKFRNMIVPIQDINASKFVWLVIIGFLFLGSCEWLNTQENDSIIALEYNPYLPLDTSDIWIYKNTSTIYEYGTDSLIGTFITYDTLQPEKVISGVSQYECRKFDNKIETLYKTS